MRTTTTSYVTNELGEPVMDTTNTTEVEERDYRAFAAALGIEPVAVAAARRSDSGTRMVRIDAREYAKLREMASFKPTPDDDDAFYERHRAMILGGAS